MVATGFLSRRFESPGLCGRTETAATTTVMLPTAVTEAPVARIPAAKQSVKTAGNSPISTLVSDAGGNLYGTTSEGGLGSGTIFKLTPAGGGHWTESVVHSFAGPPDVGFSYNGMVVDPFGNFFGATVHGGDGNDGSVYQFTP
jgi:uncharacterized repeat protein (TIGR03803 family)